MKGGQEIKTCKLNFCSIRSGETNRMKAEKSGTSIKDNLIYFFRRIAFDDAISVRKHFAVNAPRHSESSTISLDRSLFQI